RLVSRKSLDNLRQASCLRATTQAIRNEELGFSWKFGNDNADLCFPVRMHRAKGLPTPRAETSDSAMPRRGDISRYKHGTFAGAYMGLLTAFRTRKGAQVGGFRIIAEVLNSSLTPVAVNSAPDRFPYQ